MNGKQNLLRAIQHNKPQWIPNGLESSLFIHAPLIERPLNTGYDEWGVHWTLDSDPRVGTYPTRGKQPLSNVKEWHKVVQFPKLDIKQWSDLTEGFEMKPLDLQSIDQDNRLAVGLIQAGILERCNYLLGMEESLISFITEPQAMYDLCAAIADYKIEVIRLLHETIGLEMIWYGDDWGGQYNLLLPPEVWRNILKPNTQRIYNAAKKYGLIVDQHCCGKIELIFDDFVQMGPDIWNPCQPCNDLTTLKTRFGDKICFHGGIDSQFVLNRPGTTEEEVRFEVRKRIDQLGPGGGYIAGPSHNVPSDPLLIYAMNDEIQNYGRFFYSKQ